MPLEYQGVSWVSPLLQFGLGAFESMRYENGKVALWKLHAERLTQALKKWGLSENLILEGEKKIAELKPEKSLRLKLFYGLSENADLHIHLYQTDLQINSTPRRLMLFEGVRHVLPYKSSSYDFHYLNRQQALSEDYDDVVYTLDQKTLSECSTASLILVKNNSGIISTVDVLPSTSAKRLMSLDENFWSSGEIRISELNQNSELWMSNAVQGLVPIAEIKNQQGDILYQQNKYSDSMLKDWNQRLFT